MLFSAVSIETSKDIPQGAIKALEVRERGERVDWRREFWRSSLKDEDTDEKGNLLNRREV